MTLADELKSNLSDIERIDCILCRIIEDELDRDEKEALNAALSSKMGGQRISDILTANGHPVGRTTVINHRRKGHGS